MSAPLPFSVSFRFSPPSFSTIISPPLFTLCLTPDFPLFCVLIGSSCRAYIKARSLVEGSLLGLGNPSAVDIGTRWFFVVQCLPASLPLPTRSQQHPHTPVAAMKGILRHCQKSRLGPSSLQWRTTAVALFSPPQA